MKNNNKKLSTAKKSVQPPPMSFGQGMVNITNLIGVQPDFKKLTKPTQAKNGLRQFEDSKGVFYETDQFKSKKKIISE